MTNSVTAVSHGRFAVTGAIAGAVSTLVFTVIHDIFISDIWSMLVIMLIAGAVCGLCIGWSYGLLVPEPSLASWLGYNLLYLLQLILLGIVSELMFEPQTTIAALSASGDLPGGLIGQAMPLAVVFTLLTAVVITLLYRRSWAAFAAVLLTCALLVLLLGHNVFILGLVAIPRGSFYLVMEMFGLIIALNVVYVAVFVLLERRRLLGSTAVSMETG